MEYEVVIPSDTVEFTDLNDMVEQACRLSGKKAVVRRQFVVATDDLHLSMIFDNLSALLEDDASNGNGAKRAKGTKRAKAPKAQEMGRASRRIVATGYVLSLVELKKMMKAGEIDDGTVIEDAKGARFVVMGGELIKEPLS